VNLSTSFTVPLALTETWALLRDVERVAGWVPGATVETAEEGIYKGSVRVKLGPMVVDYHGTARFVEEDEATHRVVIEASGRETRGSGTAKATFSAGLSPSVAGTGVDVEVDLAITGRPAQLGQGLMQDVAERLVQDFAGRMAADLAGEESEPAAARSPDSEAGAEPPRREDALDFGRAVGLPVLRRLVWLVGGVTALIVCWLLLRRRRP
jgi:uncharacterized protein